jgi:hypothetical protein
MKKLTLLGIGLSFILTAAYADNPNKPNNNTLTLPAPPPGLVKQGKIPPGLAKQGKIPQGWNKGKKNRGQGRDNLYSGKQHGKHHGKHHWNHQGDK